MGLKNLRQEPIVDLAGQDLSGIITTMVPNPGSHCCYALLPHLATDASLETTAAPPAGQSNFNFVLPWTWRIRIRRNAA
jgi:hypothetical protein